MLSNDLERKLRALVYNEILIVSGGSPMREGDLRNCCSRADFIIAADSGLKYLDAIGILPNLIVGDFDSLTLDGWQDKYSGVETKGFTPEKDYTDTELAIEESLKLSPKQITLVCGTGSRLDHSLANMMILSRLNQAGVDAVILDDHNWVSWISEGSYHLEKSNWHFMSIVPVSLSIEVTLEGFKYPLNHRIANRGDTLTISNEWEDITRNGHIVLHSGEALLIRSRD